MQTRYLARGTSLSLTASLTASVGDTSIAAGGMPAFDLGAPLFLTRASDGATFCLGRVKAADAGSVTFAWALEEAISGSGTLFQPEDWAALPPHLRPMEHVEFELGLAERQTAGGSSVTVERAQARELVRLRLPAPPAETLERLFAFVRGLRQAGTLLFALVDGQRRVRRVALAQEKVEFGLKEFAPGEPFDIIARIDAEGVYA
jgi:hypothetical protein